MTWISLTDIYYQPSIQIIMTVKLYLELTNFLSSEVLGHSQHGNIPSAYVVVVKL